MRTLVGVYGKSGFGREVMPLVRGAPLPPKRTEFIDDAGGYSWQDFIAEPVDKSLTIAIANSQIRQKLTERAEAEGIAAADITGFHVVTMDRVKIGPGAILCSYVHLTSDIEIGKAFHANIYSYVAHDCRIGDYVTLAPKACINGNVTIGDHAYIGTGATIRQGLNIGAGAVIGMGAVVTKDVPAGATVMGNPARVRS